jgi:hypothetical protein
MNYLFLQKRFKEKKKIHVRQHTQAQESIATRKFDRHKLLSSTLNTPPFDLWVRQLFTAGDQWQRPFMAAGGKNFPCE